MAGVPENWNVIPEGWIVTTSATLGPCERAVPLWVDVTGWVTMVFIVVMYLLGTPRQFDWTNVIACVPMALPAYLRKAWPPVALSLAFGLFGLLHLLGVHT